MISSAPSFSSTSWPRRKLVELVGTDLRSLAAFRIVLALLVLVDLGQRAASLTAFYTDRGLLPRDVLLRDLAGPWVFSLSLVSGTWAVQAALAALTGAAALALLVGWRTRRATALVWLLLISAQNRNPLILNGADVLLRMLLFWAMFLPLGAWWSLDRRAAATAPLSSRYVSLGGVALLAQFVCLYWFSVLLKTGVEWRVDGTALYYALSLDAYARPLGALLLRFPRLLQTLTFTVFWWEALGPVLLLSPYRTAQLRCLAIAGFCALHLGIALTLSLGLFPLVSTLGMVCLVPSAVWDGLPALWARARRLRGALRPAPELSQPQLVAVGALPSLWRPRWPTMFAVHSRGGSVPLAGAQPLQPAVEPRPGPLRRPALLRELLVAALLGYVFWWNLATVPELRVPYPPLAVGQALRLDQEWSMFAPYPLKDDGWFVLPGRLRGGREIDVLGVTRGDLRSQPAISWEQPRSVEQTYADERWRKYLLNIWLKQYSGQRTYLSRYICDTWNAHHSGAEQLVQLQIFFMLQPTLPNYVPAATERILLWEQSCS